MPTSENRREEAARRIVEIRAEIARMEYVCSGTLLRRRKVCGKPGCRCARDPSGRHGPYYEWTRREDDKLVHSVLSSEEGKQLALAIRNSRRLRRLLRQWQRESLEAIRKPRT